jgi:uncharacterized membrane protein
MRVAPCLLVRAAQYAPTVLYLVLVLLVLLAGTAFASTADVVWKRDSWALLGGALALSLAALYTLTLLGGRRMALKFMLCMLALSWLAETVGLRFGWLFGTGYQYNPDVSPVLPGGVPLFIPLAWFSLASFPAMVLREMPTARPDGARSASRVLFKSALAALGMVACDLALDPVAVSLGLWTWAVPGPYFGVPWLNFGGWWAVSFAVFLVGYGGLGLDRTDATRIPFRYDLIWGLSQAALVVLLGVGAFHRIGSAWPVLLTLALLVPVSLGWMVGLYWKIQFYRSVRRQNGGS